MSPMPVRWDRRPYSADVLELGTCLVAVTHGDEHRGDGHAGVADPVRPDLARGRARMAT